MKNINRENLYQKSHHVRAIKVIHVLNNQLYIVLLSKSINYKAYRARTLFSNNCLNWCIFKKKLFWHFFRAKFLNFYQPQTFNFINKSICLFWIFMTVTISRTDEGQTRPKYIFNKMWNQHLLYLLYRARFGSSPSPNFKSIKYNFYKVMSWYESEDTETFHKIKIKIKMFNFSSKSILMLGSMC